MQACSAGRAARAGAVMRTRHKDRTLMMSASLDILGARMAEQGG